MAMGIVVATMAVAQGLCFMALTTVSPSAEISTIRIMKVPTKAALPAMRPSSSRAIWPRLRAPTRRASGRQALHQETNGRGASGKRWRGWGAR